MTPKILVTGSAGQIGAELVPALRARYGRDQIVAAIHKAAGSPLLREGPVETLNVSDSSAVSRVVRQYGIDTVYHLAAVLSATGEKSPDLAWEVNMQGLKNVLDVARQAKLRRVFWPSSIAVFGPDAPRKNAPQNAPLNPTTMYGVSKVAGELLCNYYFLKYGMDVRCIRYPGLISSEALPGGGTTDYAVEIFYSAIQKGSYSCFLEKNSTLPMMYMPDAVEATLKLMEAEPSKVKRHSGYNLAAISFSPEEVAAEIRKQMPAFKVTYSPDQRQKIADSWPMSIDDSEARRDWGWAHRFDLSKMTGDMLARLGPRLASAQKGV
ncbi:MAG: NAD-dependent epimerase/dehydratase family protein [Thaumarchaeota archaeon]|nr:NAD-dependent epimerase/dehydratase family protein [Nitrososphaerota archaeon]